MDPNDRSTVGRICILFSRVGRCWRFSVCPRRRQATADARRVLGWTDSLGTFCLNAAGGARCHVVTTIGECMVSVTTQDHDPVPPPDPNGPPSGPPNVKVWDVLPVVYRHAVTTPLRASVKKGKNSYRFELDSSAAANPKE